MGRSLLSVTCTDFPRAITRNAAGLWTPDQAPIRRQAEAPTSHDRSLHCSRHLASSFHDYFSGESGAAGPTIVPFRDHEFSVKLQAFGLARVVRSIH